MMETVEEVVPSCEIKSSTGKQSWIIEMIGFEDDKHRYINFLQQELARTLIDTIETSVNARNELLHFSGVGLETSKCA